MSSLPSVGDLDFDRKKVLVRGDLDVEDADNPRVGSVREIVRYLKEHNASKIKVIGHRETKYPICDDLRRDFPDVLFDDTLRNNPGEKENNQDFAKQLAEGFDIYINEAFATSHREHSSIVALPKEFKLKSRNSVAIGLRFQKELEMLSQVWEKLGKRVLVIGGVKIDDKEKFVKNMADRFEYILKGGLLPGVDLRADGLDISDNVISDYLEKIDKADVILAAGVMGKYEDLNAGKGTRMVLEAIANNSKAYKVAGGGDIETAISTYGLTDKFDWISVGGGAMLEFLSKGTLPGIDVLKR